MGGPQKCAQHDPQIQIEMWVWGASWHLGQGSPAMFHDICHGIVSTPTLQSSTTASVCKATLTPYMPFAWSMITRQTSDKQMTPMPASHNVPISTSRPSPYPNGNTTSKHNFQNCPSDFIGTTHTNIHTHMHTNLDPSTCQPVWGRRGPEGI